MSRSGITHDPDHFDEWESFTLDDDIYAGVESDLLEDWEDDGAIAEVRSEPTIITTNVVSDREKDLQLDEESAEVFSLLERSQSKRRSELMELSGPSEDELSKIEEVGIDDYIDIVLAEDSDAENGSEPQSLPRSHAGNVHSEAIEAPVSSTSDAEEDEMDEVDDNFSSIEEEDVVEMQDEETILSFGEEDVELVLQPLFEGVAVSLPTLFDEDGDVEYKTTARLGKRLVDNGVNAIFVATIDGEGNTLSRKERKNLVRSVAKSTDELVVADVTAPSIRQSVQIAGDCFEAGANAFIVTLDSNTRDPYALCEAIHSENRDAALFVKLAGPVDSLPISPEFLYDLPISGVIDATADITFFLHLVSAYSGPVYVGSTSMITTGHLMGAAGVVLVSVAINQDLVAQAFEGDAQAQAELAMWERETGSGQGSSRSVKLALESENLVSSAMRD